MVFARSALCLFRRRPVLTRRRGKCGCSFSRPRNFLAASLFTRGHQARWIAPWGRAPWRQGTILGSRRWRHTTSPVARGVLRGRQRVGRRQRAPRGTDKLGDAVEPLLIDVIDGAVTQELVRHEERGLRIHGSATCVGRGIGRGQRWSGGAAVLPHRWVQRGRLLLVPYRASGGVGGRRRRMTRWPADGSRLSNAGGEGSPALSSSAASVRHGDDGATERQTDGREATVHPYVER